MKYNVEKDSKKFYFGKQEDYSKYRPTYPTELFDFLSKEYNMKNKIIVELGAGTGKFSKIASSYCKQIYYIEPNIISEVLIIFNTPMFHFFSNL